MTDEEKRLRKRLSFHKRRMRYWANLPGGYGPTGKRLRKCDEFYELARDDAMNLKLQLEELTGQEVLVIDPKRTFQVQWNNPKATPIYL